MGLQVNSKHYESVFGIKQELLKAVVATLTKIDAELLNSKSKNDTMILDCLLIQLGMRPEEPLTRLTELNEEIFREIPPVMDRARNLLTNIPEVTRKCKDLFEQKSKYF